MRNSELKAVFFSYSQRLRRNINSEYNIIKTINERTNIDFVLFIPNSVMFDPIIAENKILLKNVRNKVRPFLSDKEMLLYLYISNRISTWDKFYDSKSISGDSHYEKAHKAKYYLQVFVNYLTEEKPDFVLLENVPHVGLDYLFYLAAKKLNIPTIILFKFEIQPYSFLIISSIEQIGDLEGLPDCPFNEYEFPLAKEKVDWWYMSPQKERFKVMPMPNKSTIMVSIQKQLIKNKRMVGLKYFSNKNSASIKRSKEDYKNVTDERDRIQTIIQKTYPYILFTLHLEPEMTVAPLGNEFMDQVDAIAILRELAPQDVYIIVKENPKQEYHMRDKWFFERIKNFKNVVYVQNVNNTDCLIENSQFVASLLGTSGWEAICRGKPALVFGSAWYKNFPGVFSIEDNPSYEELVNCNVDVDAVNEYRLKISRKLIPGMIIPATRFLKIMSKEEYGNNTNKVVNGFVWYLKKEHGFDVRIKND